jgi:hypothetical protein
MKPKYFESEGQVYMVIKPVKRLLHSKTIKEVVERGDKFVVNMNTGQFTVFNMKQKGEVEPELPAFFIWGHQGYLDEVYDARLWLFPDFDKSVERVIECYENSDRVVLNIRNTKTGVTDNLVKREGESIAKFIPRMRVFWDRVLGKYT